MTIEIEVKALVPEEKLEAIKELLTRHKEHTESTQLNHYFKGNNSKLESLAKQLFFAIDKKDYQKLMTLSTSSREVSVRTRYDSETGYEVVVKAGADAHNGSIREEISLILTDYLEDKEDKMTYLDSFILKSGYDYLSKWSRKRYELKLIDQTSKRFTYVLDHNSGYGWLLEIEKVVDEDLSLEVLERIKEDILNQLKSLQLVPLDSQLLNKMFEFYNKNWQDYYGTPKTIWSDKSFLSTLQPIA